MRPTLAFLSALFLYLFFYETAGAQQTLSDSVFREQAAAGILDLYKKETGQNLLLYNGPEYLRNGQKVKGFPFFESESLLKGAVYYNGKLYTDVGLYYDLSTDQLVINNYNNDGAIALVPEKTAYFTALHHLFVRLIPNKENAVLIKEGFYDQLYEGKVSVFAKRQKKLEASLKAEDESIYKQYNEYFLEINHLFYRISGESGLLDLLKDKKAQLKKYIKEKKISFRKDPEQAIIQTAGYYTSLTN
jgi:hypothetical protein